MTFGEKLKVLRKENGYSQEELAGLLDVSRQAVSKWESDRGTPEIDKLVQISNMFGVTLDYLLKNESPDENNQTGGYYVSREMMEGFLSYKRQWAKKVPGCCLRDAVYHSRHIHSCGKYHCAECTIHGKKKCKEEILIRKEELR